MILWIIETVIIFIICWILIFDYAKYKMNELLEIKGNIIFSKLDIVKITIHHGFIPHMYNIQYMSDSSIIKEISRFQESIHPNDAYVIIHALGPNKQKLNIVDLPLNLLSTILDAENYLLTTQICIYGRFLLHTGFKFISISTLN